MKVLLVGAGGQLGRELAALCPTTVMLSALDRAALDITDREAVERHMAEIEPDLVVNTAAFTAVDRAEEEATLAAAINAEAVEHLATAAASRNARLIHVSTDFVFDGEANRPYDTMADPRPRCEYGRSKHRGELAILRRDDLSGLVIRTAWLYSRFGHNFVKTMLRLMTTRDEVPVVADQIGTPTWARSLATAIWSAAGRSQLRGILHWTDAGVASWYDFAVAIQDEARDLELGDATCRVVPVPTDAYPTPARRPAYSVLATARSARDLGLEPIHWRRQLRSMLQELRDCGEG